MAVNSSLNKIQYTQTGTTTVFVFPYLFYDQTHLFVYTTDPVYGNVTLKALTTDYTVSGAGVSTGGSITFVTAPSVGTIITIVRSVPYTQLLNLVNNDPFPAPSVNQELDLLMMAIQQLSSGTGNVNSLAGSPLCFPITDPNSSIGLLQSAAVRSGMLLGFDSIGLPISVSTNLNSTAWETVSASLTVVKGIGYLTSGSAQLTFTLPATTAVGDTFIFLSGPGSGGFVIAQNSGQSILAGASFTTTGTSGNVSCASQGNGIVLVCVQANNLFSVTQGVGQLTFK